MSKGDNSPGASKFAGAIRKIMDRNTNNALALDFGVIQSDGSLLTDEYPISIPKSDYLVCRHLKARSATAQTTSATVGDHGDHRHSVTISVRQGLSAGDRVLVAWVRSDPVVVDIILDADGVF